MVNVIADSTLAVEIRGGTRLNLRAIKFFLLLSLALKLLTEILLLLRIETLKQ